ncbi:MAG: DUF58 domain-containing protein [Brevinematales bacterium]|nr:DUF58 domain-containing protein [Brevinematales bacterium]
METNLPIEQIISQVKHIEIKAKKLIEDNLISNYHSIFKGKGIEFNETRNYLPGDDIRDIDWNVTARMNEPYIKTYIEERQLTVIFAVDTSASNYFGILKSKRQRIAEIVAFLGFASFFNNDKCGLILFSNDIEKYVPARKNYSHLLRIIRDSWYFEGENKSTSLSKSLKSIFDLLKKKAVIFILSDFLDSGYENALLSLSKKHDVIPIVIRDNFEENIELKNIEIPFIQKMNILFDIKDSETDYKDTIKIDFPEYKTRISNYREYYKKIFKKLSLDFTETYTDENFKPIELMLRKRLFKLRH